MLLASEEGQVEIVNALLTAAKSDTGTLLETTSPLTVSISCQCVRFLPLDKKVHHVLTC